MARIAGFSTASTSPVYDPNTPLHQIGSIAYVNVNNDGLMAFRPTLYDTDVTFGLYATEDAAERAIFDVVCLRHRVARETRRARAAFDAMAAD